MNKLYIDYNPQYIRIAYTEKGLLTEFAVERSYMRGPVGNIYKGKVENVLSGMKAAFINIGLSRNGFLHVDQSLVDSRQYGAVVERKPLKLTPGDSVMCQVVKDSFGEKGVKLSLEITIPGKLCVLLPNSSFIGVSRKITDDARREYLEDLAASSVPPKSGLIIRTAAEHASDSEILSELDELVSIWKEIEKKYQTAPEKSIIYREDDLLRRALRDFSGYEIDEIYVNDDKALETASMLMPGIKINKYDGEENILLRYGLGPQINALRSREVPLSSGGFIVIDKTEALTVIDVNTGHYVGGKNLEDTVYKTNLEAAVTIARQIRARNIGGIIIVDFIDMADTAHKEEVLKVLCEAVKSDGLRTNVVSMTSLGLVEMTRKRQRPSIDSYLTQKCPHCDNGRIPSDEQRIINIREKIVAAFKDKTVTSLLLTVNPKIASALFETRLLSVDCRTIWRGKRIYVYADDSMPFEAESILSLCGSVLTLPDGSRLLY